MLSMRRVARSLGPSHQSRIPWSRVNSLVDGILGFAATVLMLRLGAPVYLEGGLGDALVDQAPYYVLYAMGFFQILSAWSVLRRLSSWTTGIDVYGMLLAFLALMMWATAPFTIDVMVGAVDNDADFASAVRLMAVTLMVPSAAYMGLFWRLERCGYFRGGLDPDLFGFARIASYTTVLWPTAGFALTYVSGWAGLAPIVAVILLGLVPLEAMSTEQYAEVG